MDCLYPLETFDVFLGITIPLEHKIVSMFQPLSC